MFLTTSVAEWEIPAASCFELDRNEYLDPDFNKFRALARAATPAASLERATEGHPEHSRRYRELMHPNGVEAELRASQVVDGECWGALAPYRKSRRLDFDDGETDFLARLGPHLAEGLRISLLATAAPDEASPDESGLVVLDPKGRVTAVTASASRWLGQLHDSMGQRLPEHRLSDAIYGVAAVARSLDGPYDGISRRPRARIRLGTGEWLLVHADELERRGQSTGEVAVMIERARPGQVISLLIRAYGLSERETDVVQGVLQGLSTAEIARITYLSPYTVQDYLKSVFQKVGVRSRRELGAKIFAEYHWPRYGDGDAKLGADGWFAEPSSATSA